MSKKFLHASGISACFCIKNDRYHVMINWWRRRTHHEHSFHELEFQKSIIAVSAKLNLWRPRDPLLPPPPGSWPSCSSARLLDCRPLRVSPKSSRGGDSGGRSPRRLPRPLLPPKRRRGGTLTSRKVAPRAARGMAPRAPTLRDLEGDQFSDAATLGVNIIYKVTS